MGPRSTRSLPRRGAGSKAFTGALVAVDTFFVGVLKGVGKVYLQTAIDCCSRHAWARLYPNKLPTMPKTAEPWSLTSLREKLIKIGAKVVSHGRYVTFQMAEVAVPRQMFAEILSLIAQLRAPPAPA
jgi:hypothetical protein